MKTSHTLNENDPLWDTEMFADAYEWGRTKRQIKKAIRRKCVSINRLDLLPDCIEYMHEKIRIIKQHRRWETNPTQYAPAEKGKPSRVIGDHYVWNGYGQWIKEVE